MKINSEKEIIQISMYCDIITMLINNHKTLSLSRICVFSYLYATELNYNKSVIDKRSKKDLVCKYLSSLSGNMESFMSSIEFILLAIDILVKNKDIIFSENAIISSSEQLCNDSVYTEDAFIGLIIEKSKSMSDKQFIREVMSNV